MTDPDDATGDPQDFRGDDDQELPGDTPEERRPPQDADDD